MNNIVLIGMPASGKSTSGVILAKTLGKGYLDVDVLIQQREGQLLQNLIDQMGMGYFFRAEEEAILSIDVENSVIATGGSAIYSETAMKHLSRNGRIIYLKLSLESIKKRLYNIHSRGIAMNPGETIEDLYSKRIPLYEKYADIVIDEEDLTCEDTVEKIIQALDQ